MLKAVAASSGGGGGGSPGGLNTQLQYNNAGTFGGITGATTDGTVVSLNAPIFNAPVLGTPTSGVATNLTGTASGLTAGSVTTNANLTGPITSVGNATSIAAQTGTGSTFVVSAAPTITGVLTASGSLTLSGNGAASTAVELLSGTLFTGGSGTTTFPQMLFQPTGTTAATTWSTAGTGLGMNFTGVGNFLDFRIGGVGRFNVDSVGNLGTNGGLTASGNITTAAAGLFVFNGRGLFSSPSGGSLQLGNTDAAGPVAQTLRAQSVVAGTSNVAGQNWTQIGSLSTGSGVSGDIVFQTGGTGAAAATQNAALTGLTIKSATAATGNPNIVLGNAATATNATDGFLHAASGAGTPTGVPTLFTGRVPIYIDTTNSQLWLYMGGAWKQPKTPAGAAIVTWQ